MMSIVRGNVYRASRSKIGYCLLGLIILYIIFCSNLLFPAYDIKGSQTLIRSVNSVTLIGPLIGEFTAIMISVDFSSGGVKNIVGRGILKNKYIIGNIVSYSVIGLIVWVVTSILMIVVDTLMYKFGILHISIGNIFLAYVLGAVYLVAIITIIVAMTAITKSGVLGCMIALFIYNISIIVSMVGKFVFRKNIDISSFSLAHYIDIASKMPSSIKVLFIGIVIGLIYIAVFAVLGIYIFNKQDIK